MSDTENQNQRYMITYKQGSNASKILSVLREQKIYVYLHGVNSRQIGARIPQHVLGLIKDVDWLEKIVDD